MSFTTTTALSQAEDVVHWRGRAYVATAAFDALSLEAHAKSPEELPPCHEEEEFLRPPDPAFFVDLFIVIFCICTAGLMAGCTMGICSLDPLTLRLKQMEGSADEKRWAEKIMPVIASHHDLLVALLLINAAANEALPIFLDKLVDSTTAILISPKTSTHWPSCGGGGSPAAGAPTGALSGCPFSGCSISGCSISGCSIISLIGIFEWARNGGGGQKFLSTDTGFCLRRGWTVM